MNHPEAMSVRDPGAFRRVRRWQRRTALVLWVGVGLAFGCGLPRPVAAQTDTTATARSLPEGHTPRRALWRAAAAPGWGQYYNRQYLKIPLVYVGLGGFTAAALYVNNRYLLYRHAFLYKANQERVDQGSIAENPWPQYEQEYQDLIADIAGGNDLASARLRAQRDNLRRNRDLLYLGIVFWYGLTMLDAFVSAHLLDFDVGEDLTLTLFPHPATSGLTATLRWGF